MRLTVDTYTDCTEGERNRTLFRTLPSGETLFLLADGSETAFAHSYQPIMDLVKECFPQAFSDSVGSILERLLLASMALESAMYQRFPSSEQFGENWYSATFIAVVILGNQSFSAWIGSQEAKLFRRGRCVKATAPHVTLVPGIGRNDFAVTSKILSTVPGQDRAQADVEGPWGLQTEDVLVIADYRLFASGSDDEIGNIVANELTSPAKALVEWAQRLQHSFAQSSLVVRFV